MKVFHRPMGIALVFSVLVALAVVTTVLADGELDTTFGAGGRVTTKISAEFAEINALAVQPDGKIVAAGASDLNGTSGFTLARYNPNGSLDTGFGQKGMIFTGGNNFAEADDLAIQPDGKIVITGPADRGFTLIRYNPDGSSDPGFGTYGTVTAFFTAQSTALALQPDGKIVVSGSINSSTSEDFIVARFNQNGSVDTGFGNHGKVTTDFGSRDDTAVDMAIQPDGKIIVAGASKIRGDSGSDDFALARYNSNGLLDTTFGRGGKVRTNFGGGDYGAAIALQPDGKIIMAGDSSTGNSDVIALARYNINGSLDTTFGVGGKVTTAMGTPVSATGIAVQPDGRIVLSAASDNFMLVRYNGDGSPDSTLGSSGIATAVVGAGGSAAASVAIQPDGRIILGGIATVNSIGEFALARFDGSPVMTFASIAAQDGWVLESSENSGVGGSRNSTAPSFRLGDDASNRQYRGLLSFNTGGLPNNAVITGVTLRLKQNSVVGGQPMALFQGFMVDIKKGFFGTTALQASDFQSAASISYGPVQATPFHDWYALDLTSMKAYVNKLATNGGLTQIRLRFKLGNNNNGVANILSLYSGEAGPADRPQLVITYYVP